MRAGLSMATPRSPVLLAEPLAETRFLVDAAARAPVRRTRSRALVDVLTQLEASDQDRRTALLAGRRA